MATFLIIRLEKDNETWQVFFTDRTMPKWLE